MSLLTLLRTTSVAVTVIITSTNNIIAQNDGTGPVVRSFSAESVKLPSAEILCSVSDVVDSSITVQLQHMRGDTLKSMVRAIDVDMITNAAGTRWSDDTLFVEASFYVCPPRSTDADSLYCLMETADSICYPNHVLIPGARYIALRLRRLSHAPKLVVYISPARDIAFYSVGRSTAKTFWDRGLVLQGWMLREQPHTDCIVR
ncbi:MAG TPA: hypothetical protein PLW14_11985 [Chlorobiota bacterium]|nr:hypothetical protein [Chlorobiota bacterium]